MKKVLSILSIILLFCGTGIAYAADVTLAWDANTETDLSGYKVHYNTVKAGPPYTTTIDVGNVVEHTFTDLDLDTNLYWFVVSAYNTGGFESGFSNEVTTTPPCTPIGVRVKVIVEISVE